MQTFEILRVALIAGIFGYPMAAFSWTKEMDRGLILFNVASDSLSLTFVCDPNDSYEADQTSVQVSISGESMPSGPVTFTFQDQEQVVVELVYGSLLRANIGSEQWELLVEGLTHNDRVDVTVGSTSMHLRTGEALPAICE